MQVTEMMMSASDTLIRASKSINVLNELLSERNKEIERLSAALRFYASPGAWLPHMLVGPAGDYGAVARSALAGAAKHEGDGLLCNKCKQLTDAAKQEVGNE